MPNSSTKTKAYWVRLPREVADIIERRVDNQNERMWWVSGKQPEMTVNKYLVKRLTYDILRKHGRH